MKPDVRHRLLDMLGLKFVLSLIAMGLIAGASAFSHLDPTMGILGALGIFAGANVSALFASKGSKARR